MSTQFSSDDLKAIEKKIAEVEKYTAGEIVVHVVSRCDGYGEFRLGWAFLLGILLAKGLTFEVPLLGPWALEVAVGASVVLWFVLGVPTLLRWMVPAAAKQAQVHRRAQVAFVENRVHRTRDASGVLILVSLFERRVEILADEGIHARVGVDGWKAHVGRIIDGVRRGEPSAGIVQTIGLIGDELKDGVPVRPDDENELSNEVVMTRN